MILPESELKLLSFDVLESYIAFVTPDARNSDIDERKYKIDLDFKVTINEDGVIFIYTYVEVNDLKADFACHVLDITAGSVFSVIPGTPGSSAKNEMEQYFPSAIGIAFNNVRGFIQNVTAYLPIGPYTLPLFDPNQLIEGKFNTEKAAPPKKTKKAAKKR